MALERKGKRGVRRGELTESEVGAAATAAEAGGFSYRMTGPGVGRPARDIIATGFAPDWGRAAEVPINKKASSAAQVGQFVKNKAKTWAVRGADWLVGGWVDDSGAVQLDTSVATPRSVGGMEAAMQMGSYGDQEAVGVIGRRGQYTEVKVPEHLSRSQFYESRGLPVPEKESIEPHVSRVLAESVNLATGQPQIKERVKIEPSRLEQVQVEAAEASRKLRLKNNK